jgi:tetratricopeptide (TPR) repeat protein
LPPVILEGDAKEQQIHPVSGPVGRQGSPRGRLVFFCLGLVLATSLLYQAALRNAFLNYDDPAYVTRNLHVLQGLSWSNVAWAFGATAEANWHPLTWISHMADVQVFGLNPVGHHFTNVLLHVANVLLLFCLLQKATGRLLRSAAVAALFALHPLNVESVAWVAERKSILSTLFLLLAGWAYASYLRSRRPARYALVAICFGLGLMAKPAIITFPFMLLLLDYWPLKRLDPGRGTGDGNSPRITFRGLLWEKVPLLVMSAGSAVITFHAQRAGGAVGSAMLLPLVWRIKNAIYSYVAYVAKLIWPSHLAVFYPHSENSLTWWSVAFAGLLVSGVTLLVWQGRKKRYLLVGWLWYLGTMVPMIGIVQVGRQGMADRYTYVPFIGLFVLIVWFSADLAAKLQLSRSVRRALGLAVLFGYASISYRQISYWRDSYTLFSHAIQVTSRNAIAEDNLGESLATMGHPELAILHFGRAIQIAPQLPTPHYNLATLLQSENELDQAKREYETTLSLSSDPTEIAQAHNNLGALAMSRNQPVAAILQFNAAIAINPGEQNSFLGRGVVEYQQGKLDAAVADFAYAAELAPSAPSEFWLGRALEEKGEWRGAARAYTAALHLAPTMEEAQSRLAALRQKLP